MTRLARPVGVGHVQADARLRARGFWLPGATVERTNTTCTGSVNDPGIWAVMSSSLAADVGWVRITPATTTALAATNSSMLIDIGTGALTAEVVVIPNLAAGYLTIASPAAPHPGWLFPISIPKGTRVVARCRATRGIVTVGVRAEFFGVTHGLKPPTSVTTYGAVTSASNAQGTTLTNPTSNNTKSAWTQITAATTDQCEALALGVQGGLDTDLPNSDINVDIGVGSAGNEVVVVADRYVAMANDETVQPVSSLGPFPVQIPAGTRIAARYSASVFTGASLDLVVHTVRLAA